MTFGYPARVAVTSLVLVCTLAVSRPNYSEYRCYRPELYSARALRRMRTLLALRLLELRKERLERVADAVQRHLSADELVNKVGADGNRGQTAPRLKQNPCPAATHA